MVNAKPMVCTHPKIPGQSCSWCPPGTPGFGPLVITYGDNMVGFGHVSGDQMVVNQDTMKKVEIKPGWLMRQFLNYVVDYPVDEYPDEYDDIRNVEQLLRGELHPEFFMALKRFDALVVQKNYQYNSSWQTLGEIIPTADMVDKLARLEGAWRDGAALKWDPNKRRGVLFDLIVRSFMVLAWEGLNFTDDDDDRNQGDSTT